LFVFLLKKTKFNPPTYRRTAASYIQLWWRWRLYLRHKWPAANAKERTQAYHALQFRNRKLKVILKRYRRQQSMVFAELRKQSKIMPMNEFPYTFVLQQQRLHQQLTTSGRYVVSLILCVCVFFL
jgi:hypothetical protein